MAQEGGERLILPKHSRPIHYDLEFELDFEKSLVRGNARIEIQILEDTDFLILNAVDIVVHNVTLVRGEEELIANTIL